MANTSLSSASLSTSQYLMYIGKERLNMPDGIDEIGLRSQYQILNMRRIDYESSEKCTLRHINCDFGQSNTNLIEKIVMSPMTIMVME